MANNLRKKNYEKIEVTIFRNSDDKIFGFKVFNHSEPIICSAVSILTLNVINSIERFTDIDFVCNADEKTLGLVEFEIPSLKNGGFDPQVDLLLSSYLLGLSGIKSEYDKFIDIIDK